MYIETYTVKVINNCRKPSKTITIPANTAQEAHKKALLKTNYFTEEIGEIKDSEDNIVFSLNTGFIE